MLHGGAPYTLLFTERHLPFTYPPFALFAFSPLSLAGKVPTVWAWDALSAVSLLVATVVAVRRASLATRTRALGIAALISGLSCLAIEPVRSTLLDGQINLFLLAAVALDLLVVPRRCRGVLVGLAAAVKLTPLVFALYFLVARDRGSALRACVTFLAAVGLSWLVLPADSATYWLHQAFSPGHKGGTRSDFNQSWWGLAGRLPASESVARMALWLALCAATLWIGTYAARALVSASRSVEAILAVALTGLLVSPVSWSHHWSWLVLVPIALVCEDGRHRAVTVAMVVLAMGVVLAPYGWHLQGPGTVVSGFSLVLAGAALLVTMAVTAWRCPPRPRVATPDPTARLVASSASTALPARP